MAEFWDLYDINKNKLGRLHQRGLPLNSGEYHLVVEIWIVNSNNQILLTQRHPDKKWGGFWEGTGGSVIAGEDGVSGARRELFEETGIGITDEQVVYLGTLPYKDWLTENISCKSRYPFMQFKITE